MRTCFVTVMVLLVSTATVAPGAEENGDAVRAGTKLLNEGDRLADQGRTTDAVVSYKKAFERLLPEVRKLPFLHEVKRDVTRREELKAVLLRDFEEDMTPEEFRANELALKAFGLVPRDYRYKEAVVQVLSEEVAAFYDPRTKTMHLIEEPKRDPAAKKAPSLLDRLLGRDGTFNKDENRTVIAHELTHALADQHYDLEALQKAVRKNDDRALALSALIEGEATLVMMGAGQEDWSGASTAKLPAETLDWAFGLTAPFMPLLGAGKSLRSAPPIVAESMMFPYLKGLVFCANLTNKGGWKALDAVYRDPPQSTEQVLHPEKYRDRRDPPTHVELGKLDAGEGWKEVGRNVLGELQLQVLLRRHGGKSAAAGWDGDRYAVFEGPGGRLGLVWLTTWDTEADAREFQTAYARYQIARHGGPPLSPAGKPSDTFWREIDHHLYIVQRRGLDVAVVEGLPAAVAPRLLEAACHARESTRGAKR